MRRIKTKRCAVCGEEYMGGERSLYCSDTCKQREEYRRRKLKQDNLLGKERTQNGMLIRHCAICGKEFLGRKQKYCSDACRKEAKKRSQKEYKKRMLEMEREKMEQQQGLQREEKAAKERVRQEIRARRRRKELQGCPIQVTYLGSCAGYRIAELCAIARENRMSYGKLTGLIACNCNRIPEGITVPDLQEALKHRRGKLEMTEEYIF